MGDGGDTLEPPSSATAQAEEMGEETPGKEKEIIYLHGDLDLRIIEARCLPNMDMLVERLRRFFAALKAFQKPLTPHRRRRNYMKQHNKIITSDPYVTVCLAGARVARTRIISNSQNPVWDEHFKIPLAHPVTQAIQTQFHHF